MFTIIHTLAYSNLYNIISEIKMRDGDGRGPLLIEVYIYMHVYIYIYVYT